jgi:hypothetical protein
MSAGQRLSASKLLLAAMVVGAFAMPAAAQSPKYKSLPTFVMPTMPQLSSLPAKGQIKFTSIKPQGTPSKAQVKQQILNGQTIPLWEGSEFTEGFGTFDFVMVGTDPSVKQKLPVSTIPALIIPIKLTFADGTVLDPSRKDKCGQPLPAVGMLINSPIFTPIPKGLTIDGTFIGKGQYVSLFQRANFWQFTKPGAVNPGYQVDLLPTFLGTLPINVNQNGFTESGGCSPEGFIDAFTLDAFLQSTILPALGQFGVGPLTVPIFLLENTILTFGCQASDAPTSQCPNGDALGYHSSFINQNNVLQTYIVSNYETNGFTDVPDVAVMSHEVGEWMNDPTASFTNAGNIVPVWFSEFNDAGCQDNLEVGDPLAGPPEALYQIKMPGFTYTVQDLAFKAWFFQDDGSTVANGFGSLFGTFESPAAFHDFCES